MKRIRKLVDKLNEEICGAKEYAEMYIESKAKNDSQWASRYSEMAEDELRHATYIHELCMDEIEKIKKIFNPPIEMVERWDKAHKKYVEKVTVIKQLLAM